MKINAIASGILLAVFANNLPSIAQSQPSAYPRMAPIAQYQMQRDAEIALARTAAPDSISRDAQILVLGDNGYGVADAGKNGFACLVLRAWAAGVDDPEFWNPKVRSPICLNAEAARSILPHEMKKTEWALAGLSTQQIAMRIKAALGSKEFPPVEPGAMCYMLSKEGHLSDRDGHWHPHLMFFTPAVDPATWGANLDGSPLLAGTNKTENVTVFLLPVEKWSDGTPGPPIK